VCLSVAAFPHYCTDPDITWGNGRGCHLVVHYWADLQSVHGFRGYDNIVPNAKCQRVLVLVPYPVAIVITSADVKPNQVRLGEHTDYGSITLLFQGDIGGLQVEIFI